MAQQQRLSTTLLLDAALTSNYKDAFKSAGKLSSDLGKQATDLKRQLNAIGKEADAVDKVGKSSADLRRQMGLLERQIKETERATERFGDAKRHFRSASIGARALKEDIKGIADTAKTTALAIAGIATASVVALSPDEELLDFDQTVRNIGMIGGADTTQLDTLKSSIRELSNTYAVSVNEIATQHEQLTRNLGFEGAQQTISAAVEFQKATGLAITDLEEELATARISLGIDTPDETREFLNLLTGAHRAGIKIDNIDLGDLETLMKRTGENVFGDIFQREFLTTIAFRQVDSFQFADYAQAFQEEFGRATLISPEMDIKALGKAQENIDNLRKWGLRAEDGILGAMRAFQELDTGQQAAFWEDLAPALGEQTVEVIARGSEALPRIQEQVDGILKSGQSMSDVAEMMSNTWSGMWKSIRFGTTNSLQILREQFAFVFAAPARDTMLKLFEFINSHQDQIRLFFTRIKDGLTPIVNRIWNAIRDAFPIIRAFAVDVWEELRRQWQAISPVANWFAEKITSIVKTTANFAIEHPKLVATLLTGIAAWKAYTLAASGVKVGLDIFSGIAAMASGHIHRITALAIAASPAFTTMGASLFTALAPVMPVILPIIGGLAVIGASAFIIYKNWQPISDFFRNHFEVIRTALMIVFPPLGLLVGFANVIRENWGGIKELFATIWETITLTAKVAFEGIQYVALSSLVFIKQSWASITEFFGSMWNNIRDFFLASPLAPIFAWMVNGVRKVISPLLNFFGDFWNNVSEMASKAIDWIIEKFQFINKVLDKAFGWLRKENEKLREDLGISADAPKIEVGNVDVPDVEMPKSLEITKPTIDTPSIEIPDTPSIEIPKTPEIATPTTPQTDIPKVEIPKVDTVSFPNQKIGQDMPDMRLARQTRSNDLVNIGLGTLKETTKQTLLLEEIRDVLTTPQLTVDDYTPPVIQSESTAVGSGSETTTNQNTRAKSEVTFNVTINQQPGQSSEELVEMMRQMVRETVNEDTETYLIQ